MTRLILLTFCLLCFSFISIGQPDWLEEAKNHFENLHYQESIEAYQKVYEQSPSDEVLRGLIRSHLELGIQFQFNGQASESKTQFSLGLAQAEKLILSNDTHDENRLLRALLYVYNGQFENARIDDEYVAQLYPNNGRAFYALWTLDPTQGLEKIEHPYVEKALSLDPNLFELYQELGSYYSGIGDVDQAITAYEKALDISPKNYKANFALGQVYWGLGNVDEMRIHFEKCLYYFPDFGYGQMLLGGVELMTGNTSKAVSLIKKALKNNPETEGYLPMYKENFPVLNNYNFKSGSQSMEAPIDEDGFPRYFQEALALAQSYDYYAASELFHRCKAGYDDYEGRQSVWSISILSWLSHCARSLGLYHEAVHSSKEALDLAIKHNVTTDQASLAANLGAIYFGWGDYAEAIAYSSRSINFLLKNGQSDHLFAAYTNLGIYYRDWEEYDSAVYYHKMALQRVADQSELQQSLAHKEMALSYSANGQTKKSLEHLDLMFEIAKNVEMNNQQAAIDLGAAQVYYKLGEYEKAYHYAMAAAPHFIALQKVTPVHPSMIEFGATFAGILANVNQIDLAHTNLMSLNSTLVNQIKYNFPAMNDQGKLIFYRKASAYFERFNSFSLTHTNVNQTVLKAMLENQLLKKGLLFNDAYKFNQMMSNTDNQVASQCYKQLIADKNLMSRTVVLTESELQLRGLNRALLQHRIDSLQQVLVRSELSEEVKIYEVDLAEKIRTQLAPNEAAVEMIRFRSFNFEKGGRFSKHVYYLALIQKGNAEQVEYVVLGNGEALEGKGYHGYVNAVNYEVKDAHSYEKYWQPIQEKLSGIDRVYFAGDGVYHKINLNTIFNTTSGNYLIDELDIRLVTSTRDIIKKSTKMPRIGSVSLIGSPTFEVEAANEIRTEPSIITNRAFVSLDNLVPLPGTSTEVKAIEKILGDTKWSATVLTEEEAVEERVKEITNPTILHIATHGYFVEALNRDNPLLYSGLFLTGAITHLRNKSQGKEDGILTAYEAMHMNLQETQMVVLSACETGMGQVENGAGVYGLQRAFLVAGAHAVVMSMWKVNDQTTMELMSDFYSKLTESKDKHLAFRQAQLSLKQKYPNPKYWGAFNIVGR